MSGASLPPIEVASLFPRLEAHLIELLDHLSEDDWRRPTVCRGWSVKDVAAHLLDGSFRRLAQQRDGYFPPPPDTDLSDNRHLVAFLNQLNASWVEAARRLSPRLLRDLLKWCSEPLCQLFARLDPEGPALFPVSWAGESHSQNWFDLAREFTERWHHQQQIRDAVGAAPLSQREFLHPVLDTFMRGLPHHYRTVDRPPGTRLAISIEGEAGGDWILLREADGWRLQLSGGTPAETEIRLKEDLAWRIFCNGVPPPEAKARVTVRGDGELASHFVHARSVMV